MKTNLILHIIKYLSATLLLWGAMLVSNVGFSLLSCLMVMSVMAMLEWLFKVWVVENMEKLARAIARKIDSSH